MNYQKNTEAILEALHLLKETDSFEMFLYGTSNPALLQMISKFGLQNNVFPMGEVPQPELAKAIQQSDALILYSRYETFGCVLIEANACGIPVIVSDIAVFHELIETGKQGIFAETENPAALAEKLKQFILQRNNFDEKWIAKTTAAKYNFSVVGQMFSDLYNRLLT
jgi:glycosyltransferase involved in cell wall biosynthesis